VRVGPGGGASVVELAGLEGFVPVPGDPRLVRGVEGGTSYERVVRLEVGAFVDPHPDLVYPAGELVACLSPGLGEVEVTVGHEPPQRGHGLGGNALELFLGLQPSVEGGVLATGEVVGERHDEPAGQVAHGDVGRGGDLVRGEHRHGPGG
jgi:hypothetical protein